MRARCVHAAAGISIHFKHSCVHRAFGQTVGLFVLPVRVCLGLRSGRAHIVHTCLRLAHTAIRMRINLLSWSKYGSVNDPSRNSHSSTSNGVSLIIFLRVMCRWELAERLSAYAARPHAFVYNRRCCNARANQQPEKKIIIIIHACKRKQSENEKATR